ncbi:MAG TPA: class I tRNA ligase family protein [Methanomassiliicoccales archaeon]|nr:class I tRNA ligase family protein [Methanomassiliicoccales archaeon]
MTERKLKSLMGSKKRKKEAAQIEKEMLLLFKSPIPHKRLFMQKKMVAYGESDPELTILVLFSYYDHKDLKVATCVHDTLIEVTKRKEAMAALLEIIMHPDREIRRNAFKFLGETKGFHSTTYISFLEQTLILMALSRKKGIPVNDISMLVEVSRQAFLDERTMEAIKDIATCLDLIKHRIRSVEHLKNYLVDVLRMAPELTRMGVYPGSIEEPIKRAIKASKTRVYDETGSIIEGRSKESLVRKELTFIGKTINSVTETRPSMEPVDIWGTDVWLLTALQELMDIVTSYTIAEENSEAMNTMVNFLGEDFKDFYLEEMAERANEGNQSAIFGLYTVGIVCLKLTAPLIPDPVEKIYQDYFRRYEKDPSIHVVMWPEIIMKILDTD